METTKTPEEIALLTDEEQVEYQMIVRDEAGALSVVDKSNVLVVSDIETKKRSVDIEKQAKKEKARDLEFLEPFVKAKKASHTKAVETRKNRINKYDEVIASEQGKRSTWDETERVRLQAEADYIAKKESAERAQRLEAIQRAISEDTEHAKDSEETIAILSMMLEETTTEEAAEMIRSQIETEQAILDGLNRQAAEEAQKAKIEASAPPPPRPVAAPKIDGEVKGYNYTVTVTDMKELCKAIGEGKVSTAAVKAAQGKLNSYAKDGIDLPGCHIDKQPTSHTRG